MKKTLNMNRVSLNKYMPFRKMLSIFILIAFFSLFFSFWFLGRCIPVGCNSTGTNGQKSCIGESIAQHMGEKSFFDHILSINEDSALLFVVILLISFCGFAFFLKDTFDDLSELLQIRCKNYSALSLNWIDFLVVLFSKGILNPKIY